MTRLVTLLVGIGTILSTVYSYGYFTANKPDETAAA